MLVGSPTCARIESDPWIWARSEQIELVDSLVDSHAFLAEGLINAIDRDNTGAAVHAVSPGCLDEGSHGFSVLSKLDNFSMESRVSDHHLAVADGYKAEQY